MFGLTFGQFMLLGILSLIAWILSDFLATVTVKFINKIKYKIRKPNFKKLREHREKILNARGYSDDEIEYLLSNPEFLSLLSQNRTSELNLYCGKSGSGMSCNSILSNYSEKELENNE